MAEYEIKMGSLRVRVEADSKEEALSKVMDATPRERRMIVENNARIVDDEPVGMGSEAE